MDCESKGDIIKIPRFSSFENPEKNEPIAQKRQFPKPASKRRFKVSKKLPD
jgi:hypothetical protein